MSVCHRGFYIIITLHIILFYLFIFLAPSITGLLIIVCNSN